MILKHYINKEVLQSSIVVMVFLTMMTMGSWLIRYFGMAAKGMLSFGVVFELMLYQMPLLLEFILPLSFFIALMLTFGRLYVEHEMSIVKTAGVSPQKFAQLLIPIMIVFFCAEMFITLYAKPAGIYAAEILKAEQSVKNTFDLVEPKEFVSINQYSLYVGSFSDDKQMLKDVVFIERGGASNGRDRVIIASRAEQVAQPALEQIEPQQKPLKYITNQLDLFQGRQYEVSADNKSYNQVSFERYRVTVKLPHNVKNKNMKLEANSTRMLFDKLPDTGAIAELGYRFSLPLSIILAIFLALPLSYVTPRQGRWVRLLPAILLFATSVLMMSSLKGSVAKGKVMVLVYPTIMLLYSFFGVYLYNKDRLHQKIKKAFLRKT